MLRILACALADAGGSTAPAAARADTPHRFNRPLAQDLAAAAAGKVVGSPVVGLLTADVYAAYLENAIEAGRRKLGASG